MHTRDSYLDLMQVAIDAYPMERVALRQTSTGERLTLQPFSRLTCVASCLVAAGRLPNRVDHVLAMVSECCAEIAVLERDMAADFAMKEIMLAIGFLDGVASEEQRVRWFEDLRKVEPSRIYQFVIREPAVDHRPGDGGPAVVELPEDSGWQTP